jgi:hypothetical protein
MGVFAYPRKNHHSRKNTLNFEDVRERPRQADEIRFGKQCFIDEVPRRHSTAPVVSTHPYRMKTPLS